MSDTGSYCSTAIDPTLVLETLDYTIRIGNTPTFLFRFVSLLCLRNTPRLFLF